MFRSVFTSIEKGVQSKNVYYWVLVFAGMLVTGFFFVVVFRSVSYPSSHPTQAIAGTSVKTIPDTEEKNRAFPTRLVIPSISVNAAVEYVGLTSDGAMDVPKTPSDVAWFDLGPHPGDIGSAVIAGHFGRWKNGKGSVFDDLNRLQKGDTVFIEDESGLSTAFVVRERRMYDANANAPEVFGSNDGKSHLNLITCDGVWNATQKQYSSRLVIFTDRVSD